MKKFLLLFVVSSCLLSAPLLAEQKEPRLNEAKLVEFDKLLRDSKVYAGLREERIDYLSGLLEECKEPLQEYELLRRLFDEYYSYNFDAALEYGNRAAAAAGRMNNRKLISESNLGVAQLYTVAGMYAEALGAFARVDTLALPPQSKSDYYKARIHYNRDFKEYSKDESMRRECDQKLGYYRQRLYDLPKKVGQLSERYRLDSLSTRLLEYYDKHDYTQALDCAMKAVAMTTPSQHDYAIIAYYISMVYDELGDYDSQLDWLLRSATTDMRLAVKDHASLCMLASLRAQVDDVERAFRYIRASTDDAMFYNAKLRQWQVASRMNTIEDAYHKSVRQQQRINTHATVAMSLLAAVLLGACMYVVLLLRRMAKTQSDLKAKNEEVVAVNNALKETNKRLSELNLSIAEANMVKEEYIGLFLSMCSDYIDKIASMQRRVRKGIKSGSIAELNREFPSSDIIDAEKEHFYEVFDSAFLNLYPNFVDEFNSLLEEDGQIEVKKGERLNTELRIFALVRLGITDSSKIALLLHYSVNTIYNYRAKVKNRAKGNREEFEQKIRTLGSFRA